LSSEVFSPGTAAVEDEAESLVIDSLLDEAQAESNNAIIKIRRPATTACLITDDEPISSTSRMQADAFGIPAKVTPTNTVARRRCHLG
jgi:hypothetical protein